MKQKNRKEGIIITLLILNLMASAAMGIYLVSASRETEGGGK